jgi:hypothetical protein
VARDESIEEVEVVDRSTVHLDDLAVLDADRRLAVRGRGKGDQALLGGDRQLAVERSGPRVEKVESVPAGSHERILRREWLT